MSIGLEVKMVITWVTKSRRRIVLSILLVLVLLSVTGIVSLMIVDDCFLSSKEEFVFKISSDINQGGEVYSELVLCLCRSDLSGSTSNGIPYLYAALLGFTYSNPYKVELAELMVERGQNINAKDQYGLTLLHMVVFDENVDAVHFLVTHGVNVNEVSTLTFSNNGDKQQLNLTSLGLARYLVKQGKAKSIDKMKKILVLLESKINENVSRL
jgi:ankyrin repeat protein